MPELPEVETIVRQLNSELKGETIEKVELISPGVLKDIEPADFVNQVEGRKVLNVNRRGKLILVELEKDLTVLIHLRLTGKIVGFNGDRVKKDFSTRAIFYFKGKGFCFNDLRKFGSLCLVDLLERERILSKLGPEPLDSTFGLENFQSLLFSQGRKKVKPLLMDQSFLAGIGNIYADEILYFAGVKPDRFVFTLTPLEVRRIFEGIKKVLVEAIEAKGTSFRDYVDFSGKKGGYLYRLKVYRRSGEPCYNCGCLIKKMRLAGRSTHFCPSCQK